MPGDLIDVGADAPDFDGELSEEFSGDGRNDSLLFQHGEGGIPHEGSDFHAKGGGRLSYGVEVRFVEVAGHTMGIGTMGHDKGVR